MSMQVKVWEEKIMIPTYEVGEADKNPIFIDNDKKIREINRDNT